MISCGGFVSALLQHHSPQRPCLLSQRTDLHCCISICKPGLCGSLFVAHCNSVRSRDLLLLSLLLLLVDSRLRAEDFFLRVASVYVGVFVEILAYTESQAGCSGPGPLLLTSRAMQNVQNCYSFKGLASARRGSASITDLSHHKATINQTAWSCMSARPASWT